MRQQYHSIIKASADGSFLGWVEEVPGTITSGHSIEECRTNLQSSLAIMLESLRAEAREPLDRDCIQEVMEIDVDDAVLGSMQLVH